MNRYDEAISAADDKLRKDWERGSAELLQAIRYAREGIDPQMPLFSWVPNVDI
jgi:hypothetical protein